MRSFNLGEEPARSADDERHGGNREYELASQLSLIPEPENGSLGVQPVAFALPEWP